VLPIPGRCPGSPDARGAPCEMGCVRSMRRKGLRMTKRRGYNPSERLRSRRALEQPMGEFIGWRRGAWIHRCGRATVFLREDQKQCGVCGLARPEESATTVSGGGG